VLNFITTIFVVRFRAPSDGSRSEPNLKNTCYGEWAIMNGWDPEHAQRSHGESIQHPHLVRFWGSDADRHQTRNDGTERSHHDVLDNASVEQLVSVATHLNLRIAVEHHSPNMLWVLPTN
jgi:hypothetical protein